MKISTKYFVSKNSADKTVDIWSASYHTLCQTQMITAQNVEIYFILNLTGRQATRLNAAFQSLYISFSNEISK